MRATNPMIDFATTALTQFVTGWIRFAVHGPERSLIACSVRPDGLATEKRGH